MKKLFQLTMLALFAVFGAFALATFVPQVATAQDNEEQSENQEEQAEDRDNEDENEEQSSSYNYTAQAGDSYTKIARKAVQTYGWNNDTDLSLAEIVAAETFLTSDAGFPALDEGQSVVLSEEAVEAAVKKAQDLDDNAEARWERYVKFVDFNTDNVGEARS